MAENITNNAAWEQAKCLPRHIAIILDGNRPLGQKASPAAQCRTSCRIGDIRNIATYSKEIGVEYLTVYAFSTENWKRPEEEVGGIMKLLDKYLHEAIRDMRKKNIRMKVFGDVSRLSPQLQQLIAETDEISKDIEGFQANICINYGGRAEIVRAAQAYAEVTPPERSPIVSPRTCFQITCILPAFQTRIFSFARAESTGFQTFCSGSAHTRSFIIPTHCGRISLRRNWIRRSKRITAATAVSEV